MRRPSPLTKSVPAVAIAGLLALAGCGSDSTSDPAPPPSDPDAPVSGTLRTFTYSDTASDVILAPFRKQNPDLDLKTATFDSVQEGSAKIAGGYETDVVQACTDEYQPLLARDLLRPIDPKGITAWDDLDFRDNEGVQRSDGLINFVPIAAGPQGILYNTDEVDPPPDSWADLFDPEYAGRTTIDGGTWLTPLAEAAFAMGIENPMKMTDEQVEDAKQYLIDHRDQFRSYADSDSDKVNLFKSGEVVIADGGRGTAAQLRADGQPVEWVGPDEGTLAWVCGLGITSDAQNIPAAYKLINYFTSERAQATIAAAAYTIANPTALPDVPKALRATADSSSLDDVIAEVQPDNYQTWVRAWKEVKAGG